VQRILGRARKAFCDRTNLAFPASRTLEVLDAFRRSANRLVAFMTLDDEGLRYLPDIWARTGLLPARAQELYAQGT
jgi:hypothetical protein